MMMFYTPTPEAAFNSIEYLMRDVPCGWFIRYLHSSGASFFSFCFTRIYCVVCSMVPIKNPENWFSY
ncbi:hypothetical protein [Rickettsiella massiliensis]|uniref:hypothetical protein n=1 Tax=Rickettsiella massiliensis TaxID=676517 RepID=UPI001F43CCD2|nr:hypothetical protein [Rickettsiella massiliensis]